MTEDEGNDIVMVAAGNHEAAILEYGWGSPEEKAAMERYWDAEVEAERLRLEGEGKG